MKDNQTSTFLFIVTFKIVFEMVKDNPFMKDFTIFNNTYLHTA